MAMIACGPLRLRIPNGPMKKGELVLGHCHNFAHPTLCVNGSILVRVLDDVVLDAMGRVTSAKIVREVTLDSRTRCFFFLVEKGVYHSLESLEDGAMYVCAYPHRAPQAITLGKPGQQPTLPDFRRDENGILWERVDETLLEIDNNWAPAYE